jgi:hypothetical protein
MARSRSRDGTNFTLSRRAGAFVRGLPALEPLVNVAREGLSVEGLSPESRAAFALRIAESGSSSCGEILMLIRTLSAGAPGPVDGGGPYRSTAPAVEIPPAVQDRLCELYRARYREAMEAHLEAGRRSQDPEGASHLVRARMNSRVEKAADAYGLLKSGAMTSPQARRHLTAVFCDAAEDVLAGLLIFNEGTERIREGIIREFGGERIRGLIPYGICTYEASRIIIVVSKALCGSDMRELRPAGSR